ncbi:MAG TPA: hypothetical protein VK666_26250 [Chryseolinea sp.]|nr:hypothetical protein [Chryseolinea sp.]
MPFVFAGLATMVTFFPVTAQLSTFHQGKIKYEIPWLSTLSAGKSWHLPGLNPDKQINTKQQIPHMSLPVNTTSLLGDNFWLGSVTQQSYNQGKIGRFYYWDVQGNLRGSYLFLDIAGKNKRGLKLVFPRHKALF